MKSPRTLAERIIDGNLSSAAAARGIIRLKRNNLVERPWGGLRMLAYKGCAPLPDQKTITGMGVGEAFETAACPSDPESAEHPSIALLPDGSEIALPQLLRSAGREILGEKLYEQFHGEIPLLPKTLDIQELLSIQAHPPGNTELYIIIDAEAGATIRLGFRHNIDPESLRDELVAGRRTQEALLGFLRSDVDPHELQAVLAPWLADRQAPPGAAVAALQPMQKSGTDLTELESCLGLLKSVYWHVLDLMNEIPVRAGQVIYNATPRRVRDATGLPESAEVHALGNPGCREILMLEIRRPGVTYRAWDNVRFPIRDIDIDRTLGAMHLGATSAEEFEVAPDAVPGQPGVYRSVASECFVVDHIRPNPDPVRVADGGFRTLHVIAGTATLTDGEGAQTRLGTGESALVPAAVNGFQVEGNAHAEIISVTLP